MSAHFCELSYKDARVTVQLGGKTYSIPAQPRDGAVDVASSPDSAPSHGLGEKDFLTAMQAKRAIRKGKESFLLYIREGPSGTQADRPEASPPPGCAHPSEASEDLFPDQPTSVPILGGESLVGDSEVESLLQEYSDVLQDLPAGLPPERAVHHSIPLVPGAQPVHRPSYRMSPQEREVVREYVDKLVKNGWVVPSTSPWGAPILLIPKPDGSMRVCVDYRALNSLTVKNRYALPRVDDLLDSLSGAQVFSALDLASGYWQIRISDNDAAKTGFNTHEGHYEWKVLPMGLCNAPATFQHTMNTIFAGKGLGKFVAVYLDDILVYSRTPEEHVQHLRQVFEVLREHQFYCKPSKCQFAKAELKYLGHIVGRHGLKVDPAKIEKVQNWPRPRTVTKVRSFLGLATYFRRFIQGFSALARPLHRLTQNDMAHLPEVPWSAECEASFQALKTALTTAPVLKLPEYDKPFEIIVDASVHGIGAVLMQDGHPVAYESRKFSPAEYNYDTGEQEMAAVVHALQHFRCYVGTNRFRLVTDHEPLTFFKSQALLSRKHARWHDFLTGFDFEFVHVPGRINVADPLSRMYHAVSAVVRHTVATGLLAAGRQSSSAVSPVAAVVDDPLLQAVKGAYGGDPLFQDKQWIADSRLTWKDELWWRESGGQQVLAVPADSALRLRILQAVHDSPVAGGHFGQGKTRRLAQRLYWWPKMGADIAKHVRECHTCQRIKSPNYSPYGQLQPHEVPAELWETMSLDFIVKLPPTKAGHDAVLVVVDRLSKYAVFTPCSETLDSPGLVRLLVDKVVAVHGFPRCIISDRDVRVTAKCFQDWCTSHGIVSRMNTAYHSRGNGQAERFNLTLENYLRAYVDSSHDNWDELLSVAQLAVNNSYQGTVKNSPFYLNHGRHPWMPGVTYQAAGVDSGTRLEERAKWPAEHRLAVDRARVCLKEAAERMKRMFDKGRTAKEFEVGEQVMLSTRNLRFKGPGCSKLMPRFVGPLKIIERVGKVSYRLDLPSTMRVHPVFHVELLKEFHGDYTTPPPLLECEDGTVLWQVDKVVKVRGKGAKRQYLVQWAGFGREFDSWEPRRTLLVDCPQGVAEFGEWQAQNPRRRSQRRQD
jgi:hypothetical protein